MILFYNDLLRVKSIIPHGGRGVLWLNYVYNLQKYLTWPRWKRRFEQFRVASGLVNDDASKQISTLLYCIGEEAEAVLININKYY